MERNGDMTVDLCVYANMLSLSSNSGGSDAVKGGFQKYCVVPKDAIAELPTNIPTATGSRATTWDFRPRRRDCFRRIS